MNINSSPKLMTHLYFGDPAEEFSVKLAKTLSDAGADILEIGIPYTDPVCDGVVFQRACARALAVGITPPKVFEGIKKIRQMGITKPIYLTSYYAVVFKMGADAFIAKAKEAGVRGLIIPDFLLEEQEELQKASKKQGLSLIQFATVYSSKERLQQISEASTDFIYCISLPGVTGDSKKNLDLLKELILNLKKMTQQKIFVGFGISNPSDAERIASLGSDGIIVGSAIARIYEKFISKKEKPEKSLGEITAFVRDLKRVKI